MMPYLPCRDGFRIIPANLIVHLSQRHEIHLLALLDGSEDDTQRAWSTTYCAGVTAVAAKGELSLTPSKRRGRTPMENKVRDKLDELRPDVLHIEGASLAPLGRLALSGPFKLLSAHDSLQLRFRDFARHSPDATGRLRSRILAFFARRFEKRWYKNFDRIVVTSELDRGAIEDVVDVPIGVIPNGVDLDFFQFKPDPEGGHLVFTGNMSWPPNEDAACYFVDEILPRIRAERGDAHFTIAGAAPSPRVRALGTAPGVTVTGTVADIRPSVWRAEVYVSPLRFGAGVKNKILEAMALGAPVVATRRSFTGTSVVDGVQALIADEPGPFARTVLRLLGNAEERQRLSLEGRKLVETCYTWSSVAKSFEGYYPVPDDSAGRAHPAVGVSL